VVSRLEQTGGTCRLEQTARPASWSRQRTSRSEGQGTSRLEPTGETSRLEQTKETRALTDRCTSRLE
jgi:hypothetical protein